MSKLSVGDTVMWSGGFGYHVKHPAVIKRMELCEVPNSKYGKNVESVTWQDVEDELVIFDLENGSWAYSEQITPYKGENNVE